MNTLDTANRLNWFTASSKQFGKERQECEFLHELADTVVNPTASETYWFTVNLPREGLVVAFYVVLRQAVPTSLAGVWMYRGLASDPLLIEHMNYRYSLPRPRFVGSKLPIAPIGLEIDIIEPLRRWRVVYQPAGGRVEADIECEALTPLVVASTNEHFDQAIWCKGSLRIGSERYAVDAPGFRDRTWNAARGEDPLAYPPLDYSWGVLDHGAAAFCIRSADDPALGVEWSGRFALTSEQVFHGGWLYLGGELRAITNASKHSARDFSCKARPLSQRIAFDDDRGHAHVLEGHVVGAMFYHPWGNVGAWMSNTQWTLDDQHHGNGEIQELMWSDYAKTYWK